MLKIGLTGGIGAGKSLVARVFSILGVPVYNSDIESKRLTNTHKGIRSELILNFGSEVYHSDDSLNRKYLAEQIFGDQDKLKLVNSIIHPVVRADFKSWCSNKVNCPYVIQESAILFETGLYLNFDKIISVNASIDERIARVEIRDSIALKEIMARIKNQICDEERIKKSDFTIYNNYSDRLLPQIIYIHDKS